MFKEIASFSAMGQQKARLLEGENCLRLECLIDGDWSCLWFSSTNGLKQRIRAMRAFNEYLQGRTEKYLGLELVS